MNNLVTLSDLDKTTIDEILSKAKAFQQNPVQDILKGKKVNPNVQAIVVPGSGRIRRQAQEEGLDKIFTEAGFEWRYAGCSMCLGMNDDQLGKGERCASSSNRNFEGRQGKGGRTHLVSPIMAAAAAIEGHFVDVREWELNKDL